LCALRHRDRVHNLRQQEGHGVQARLGPGRQGRVVDETATHYDLTRVRIAGDAGPPVGVLRGASLPGVAALDGGGIASRSVCRCPLCDTALCRFIRSRGPVMQCRLRRGLLHRLFHRLFVSTRGKYAVALVIETNKRLIRALFFLYNHL
jgi:hypothetical protein